MAELVLGTLGIVPLIGLAIKSYRSLSHKLKVFQHSSSVVHRVRKKLRVQYRVFENECQLLLRDCLDDDAVVQVMMGDPDHHHWNSDQLGRDVRKTLKDNYEDCVELIQDILEATQGLQSELEVFKDSKSKAKGEKLKETWKRVEDGVKISFKKESYEAGIAELRNSNSDLKSLREQISHLRRPVQRTSQLKRPITGPAGWTDIGQASKALHQALLTAWSCGQSNHVRHFVKLFLDAEKAGEDVQMRLAILCHRMGLVSNQMDLVLLQVKSKHTNCGYKSRITDPLAMQEQENGSQKKRKIVRFADILPEETTSMVVRKDDGTLKPSADIPSDLLYSRDFCASLLHQCSRGTACDTVQCLGYIDVGNEGSYRHQFFASATYGAQRLGSSELKPKNLTRMDSILCDLTKYKFSTVDKLKMARSLVHAVLNFHATPWLGESWRLQDLSFFNEEADISRSLRTLHVDVEVHRKELVQPAAAASSGDDVAMTNLPDSQLSKLDELARLTYGIHNVALHCLGVALLQIDHSQPVEPSDVLSARKLAKLPSPLGPQFQEITEKCLRCDFGHGADLGRTQLQKAVYDSVVGTLENMISVLDIVD